MDENTEKDITAPPAPTHDAGAPPSSPEPDEDAVRQGVEKLEQAGGGH